MPIDTHDTNVDVPVPYMVPDAVELGPLSDAEMRELLGKVRDLHAAMQYVKNEGPGMVRTVMDGNPMLKMFGSMFPGGK